MYRDLLGATHVGDPFDLPAQGVRVCFVDAPNSQIELIEPLGAGLATRKISREESARGAASSVLRGGGYRGGAGVYDAKGVRILGPTRIGAHGTPIFFLHPKDMGGVLTEIMESPKQAH